MNLLVPTLGLDVSMLKRLADSIDYGFTHRLLVNNGTSDLGNFRVYNDFMGWECGNIGVAGAWNVSSKFPESTTLVNDDVWFEPGSLKALISEPSMITLSSIGWSCFVWTKQAQDLLGTFDENFWPAYWEDTDMKMRMINAGVTPHICTAPMGHEKPKGHMEKYYDALSACWDTNKRYFEAKWGPYEVSVEQGKPFKTPFNRGGSIKEWTLDKDRRKHFETLWNSKL